ncbi:RNA polymerase recycling motor HelD [Paenibacillus sp. LHD-117]|uniref:RNA polymerase recycling motor HelD n=1 Tax=Paenibacillus sp. LHD-117 TaxID=3071412 RepID=UPI0027E19C62|nr:RNA polymerase recycling motor HelD [Paenibacillus sp. LHD-117]MDQ6421093.1 RNA polymerase recycling motor HelD [Paenibacillus sp. LHD-117]
MSNTNHHPEQHAEQSRVSDMIAIIAGRIESLREQTGGVRGEIVDIRRNFWDDVTVNFEDSAETAETYASMKQQAELLSERERSHRHLEQQLSTLIRLARSPYFGRIDLVEEGGDKDEAETIYLGVGSLLDDSGERYLIYDWRAPVSSLYYDYGPGPVSYETPGGFIKGEMTLKRQFVIRDGRIRSMFDTGVTIGDELLQEVLGQQSDAQMKSIVATIQSEQNKIIRNEKARLLIVQGAAGSGKTSAALQRVAYLLYRYRGTLNADQIVLFSPNPMFNSYVSTVLPELGEQNMAQTTYQQYLAHRLSRDFELEDPFTQMEYTLSGNDDEDYGHRLAGIAYKSGAAFMEIIDSYAASLGNAGIAFSPIMFRGRALVTRETMERRFYELDRTVSIPNRIRMLAGWLLKELTALGKKERKKRWVDEAIELLDQETYAGAYHELRRKNKFTEQSFSDFDSERDYLAGQVVQEKFKKLRRRVKSLAFLDVPAIYRSLFGQDGEGGLIAQHTSEGASRSLRLLLPSGWDGIRKLTLKQLEAGVMPYEDATPYLYLKEKLEGFQTNTSVKHVFVDEAQDYSVFQYQYLKRIFPNAKFTALGDCNQAIFAHSGTGDGFQGLASLFEPGETERITLLRSYRSTRQIVEFTSVIIGAEDEIVPFNRSGEEPSISIVPDLQAGLAVIKEKLLEWRESGFASCAVICKTAAESKELYLSLKPDIPELALVNKETMTFEKGLIVIPSYLAKGVEFDAVVIGNASEEVYHKESERKLFYTACTRAMHALHLISVGILTPFLPISESSSKSR